MNAIRNMKTSRKILFGVAGLVGVGLATGFIRFDFEYVYYNDGKVTKTNRKDIKIGDSIESVEAKK